MFVDDVPRGGAVMVVACGHVKDVPTAFARALTSTARAIARSERCEAIGLTLATTGSVKGTVAVPMTTPCEEAWMRMESAAAAARWTPTTNEDDDDDALRDALCVAILSLKCYRGCDEKNVVLVSRRPIRLSRDATRRVSSARWKAGVRAHVFRSVDGVESSPDEEETMRALVKCSESGGCLRRSLGCCFECGLTVGVKADFALPDGLTDVGVLRDDDDEDDDGVEDDDAVASSEVSRVVYSPGCRDEHAEFRDIPEAELEEMEASATTSLNMHVNVRKLVKGARGYERKKVTRNVLISVDEVQRVVKSLDEPLVRVPCGVMLPCYGRSGRLDGPATLKVDASTRFTKSALELWLVPANDDLVFLFTRQRPRYIETVLQKITRRRADAFCRASTTGDDEDVANARHLGLPTITHPLSADTSGRVFSLSLGAGVGRQEKFYWLTNPDLREGIEQLQTLKAMLAAPPTLQSHSNVSQSSLDDMRFVDQAMREMTTEVDDTSRQPPRRANDGRASSTPRPQSQPTRLETARDATTSTMSSKEWLASISKKTGVYEYECASLTETSADASVADASVPASDTSVAETARDDERDEDDNPSSTTQTMENQRINVANLSHFFK